MLPPEITKIAKIKKVTEVNCTCTSFSICYICIKEQVESVKEMIEVYVKELESSQIFDRLVANLVWLAYCHIELPAKEHLVYAKACWKMIPKEYWAAVIARISQETSEYTKGHSAASFWSGVFREIKENGFGD